MDRINQRPCHIRHLVGTTTIPYFRSLGHEPSNKLDSKDINFKICQLGYNHMNQEQVNTNHRFTHKHYCHGLNGLKMDSFDQQWFRDPVRFNH